FAVLRDLDAGIEGKGGELGLGQPLIALAPYILALVPPDLDGAELLQQRVLEPGVEGEEALVLLHPDPVDVVGRLLGDRLGAGLRGREAHHLVAAREDAHERGHHAVDRLGDIARDDLAAPLDLVAEGLALVEPLGGAPRLGEPPALKAERAMDLRLQDRLEVRIGHLGHGNSHSPSPLGERAGVRASRRAATATNDRPRKSPPRLPSGGRTSSTYPFCTHSLRAGQAKNARTRASPVRRETFNPRRSFFGEAAMHRDKREKESLPYFRPWPDTLSEEEWTC